MIIDSSAIVAILDREPERGAMLEAISRTSERRMAAGAYLEICIVVDGRRDPLRSRQLDRLLARIGIEIVDFSAAHARAARLAYRDFGKGSGHPAGLNFGDCFSYALATELDEPLLYKGSDFVHTDVRSALA